MSDIKITKTIVQNLDEGDNVVSETITTVEVRPVEDTGELFGMYL